MARQYLIPGMAMINDTATGYEYFIPGYGYVNEETGSVIVTALIIRTLMGVGI